eukprot:9504153-Pyramimonas_sp.AAC.1
MSSSFMRCSSGVSSSDSPLRKPDRRPAALRRSLSSSSNFPANHGQCFRNSSFQARVLDAPPLLFSATGARGSDAKSALSGPPTSSHAIS